MILSTGHAAPSTKIPKCDIPFCKNHRPARYFLTSHQGNRDRARTLPSSLFVCNTTSGSCVSVWNGGCVENMIAFFDEKPQNVLTRPANEVYRAKYLRIVGGACCLAQSRWLHARRLLSEYEEE